MTLYNCGSPVSTQFPQTGKIYTIEHGLKWVVGAIMLHEREVYYCVYKLTSPPSPLISLRHLSDFLKITPPAIITDLNYEAILTAEQLDALSKEGKLELYSSASQL
ncbi:hypothetical protein [Entomobacter blattae]|uniref:Uncharacterized protein n=1 Tax=Entomobacter blattae TaxID=2762277 RepID=A0A7H1NR95_9PROT|nr:hypothetical protein [Entomobacter blattae]QNT78305.1 hypothetical protein JGUZn3_10770 [Entomobacter blattae]